MLERLLIQNYQAHGRLRVDFAPGITTIIGPSDVGKSSIIRALRWVCTNAPGGDAFIRHGGKGATVKLMVDGHTITRRRTPGGDTNEYLLDDKLFKAFGRKVPDEILALLNIGGVCWQGQHDAPYWFSATPGEVSRALNSIVNLGIIDDTLAAVAKAVHRGRTKLEMAEEGLTEAKTAHDDLAWTAKFTEDLAVVEAAVDRHNEARHKATLVAAIVEDARLHQATHTTATAATEAAGVMVRAGRVAMAAAQQSKLLCQLGGTARRLLGAADVPVPPTKDIEQAYTDWKDSTKRGKALHVLLYDIERKEDVLWQAESKLKAAKKAIPILEICPTCGRSS